MKTMLKRNLVRAGFFGPGLFLVIPITGIKTDPGGTSRELPVLNYEVQSLQDTAIADRVDSVAFTASTAVNSEKEITAAPSVQLNKSVSKFVKSFLKKEDEALTKVKLRSKSY